MLSYPCLFQKSVLAKIPSSPLSQTYRAFLPMVARTLPQNSFCRTFHRNQTSSATSKTDTLIIGGGPVGSSVAYHLATNSRSNDGRGIVVVERDPTYSKASATLSAGGIRQQFSLFENVQMSLYGRDFLRTAHQRLQTETNPNVDLQFQEHGYLFLASTETGVHQMNENHRVQCRAGCADIHLLPPTELKESFPWMNMSDVLLGSFGSRGEGWFDPWALLKGLKDKNIEMGVTYIHGEPIGAKRDPTTGRILSVVVREAESGQTVKHSVNSVVNGAGAHAEQLMNLLAGPDLPLKYPLPVKPRKRCIFFFHCSAPTGVPTIAPLTVDSSMVYFRSEGHPGQGNFLCGVSPRSENDPDCYDIRELENADHHLFDEVIWPALFHRVPAFGEIKVKSSWAGLYDYNTVDHNAIIDFHPEMNNVLMLNGFSGHGLQQSPAAGRAGAELLDYGRFVTLDLDIFRFDRIQNDEPVLEVGIV